MVDERLRKTALIVLPIMAAVTLIAVGATGAYFKDDVNIGNVFVLISIIGAAVFAFLSLLFRRKTGLVIGLMLAFLLATPVVFYLINKPTTTTFGEALPNHISSGQMITEIQIYSEMGKPFKSVTLESPEEMKSLLQIPSDMTLVTSDEGLSTHLYSIWLEGGSYEDEIQIVVGKDAVRIWGRMDGEGVGGEYKIEGENTLLQVIENGEFDWIKG
ncbi:hypothetical protein [Halobacillus sp. Nhm2S1]|uniref:hypothetical protein n=1 Tax=Halobacillus sp. Nhm2S1 TaxID=2866716 RepID=UPI001C739192|nr:hypothetical protein [Halobacillus sp. Nhm2S1]MBX0356713.1 hypothetical protein [Halobacillus sp. Nhm2S1]